jgi:hypothetical protein
MYFVYFQKVELGTIGRHIFTPTDEGLSENNSFSNRGTISTTHLLPLDLVQGRWMTIS